MALRQFWVAALLLGGVLAAAGGGYLFFANKNLNPASELVSAHPFELKDLQGKVWDLEHFKGKFTVLHFWASWCAPCLEELPKILQWSKGFPKDRFALLIVSLDEKWADAREVLPKNPLPENVVSVIDPDSSLANQYGSYQFPETYFITPDQKVSSKWVGPQDWNASYFQKRVEEYISKQN